MIEELMIIAGIPMRRSASIMDWFAEAVRAVMDSSGGHQTRCGSAFLCYAARIVT